MTAFYNYKYNKQRLIKEDKRLNELEKEAISYLNENVLNLDVTCHFDVVSVKKPKAWADFKLFVR